MAIEDLGAQLNGKDPHEHLGALGKAMKLGKPLPKADPSPSEDEKKDSSK
jgi:hypothetical protein